MNGRNVFSLTFILMLVLTFLTGPTHSWAEEGDPREGGLVSTWTSAPYVPRASMAPNSVYRPNTLVGPVVTFPTYGNNPLAPYLDWRSLRQARLNALSQAAIAKINFAFDSVDLDEEANRAIDELAQLLTNNPDIGLNLDGHTDLVGEDNYNKGLGERRALQVREALMEKGIAPARLQAVSYGEEFPLYFTLEPARTNRRVNSVLRDLFTEGPTQEGTVEISPEED
jgi:outer membrane protein OmpA-like peptidoglycan-associated protein